MAGIPDTTDVQTWLNYLDEIQFTANLLTGWVDLGELAYLLVEQVFGLPDPMDLLLSALAGRPTLEATIDQAKSLKQYKSPALQLLAIGAGLLAKAGIPISSPEAAPIFGKFFAAAVYIENAIRWQSQTPNVGNLDALTLKQALYEAGNPGVAGTATLTAIEDAYNQYPSKDPTYGAMQTIADWTDTDPGHQLAEGVAKRYLSTHQPTTPPAPPPTVTVPSLPAPPLNPGIDGDELTDFSFAVTTFLYFIAYTMANPLTTNGEQSQCCDQLIAAVIQLQTALSALPAAIQALNSGAGTAALVTPLEYVAHNIKLLMEAMIPAMQQATDQLCACIGQPLQDLAAPPPDTAALKPPPRFNFDAFIEQLSQDQAIDPALAQLLTST